MTLASVGGAFWGTGSAWRRFACAIFHFMPSLKYLRLVPSSQSVPTPCTLAELSLKASADVVGRASPAATSALQWIAAAPRDRGAPAMAETLTGQQGPLRRLDEFTTTARQLIRIRTILWREAGLGNSWWVPKEWHPNPAWVAVIDLCRIQGMGETSRRVVRRWLEANKMRMEGAGQRSQRPDMES